MKEYLLNLHRINEKIRDPSEFYEFTKAVECFLEKEDDHSIYIDSVKKAVKTIKKSLPLDCILTIASFLRVNKGFIDELLVQKFIKRSSLWDSVLRYLSAFKINNFDEKIALLVENHSQFCTNGVYSYIRSKKYLASGLLQSTKQADIPKKLDFIINCKIYSSIEEPLLLEYVHLLGHRTKTIALKAFELFWIFFKETNRSTTAVVDITNSTAADSKYHIRIPEKSLIIDESRHFIIFGWCFLPESDEILNTVKYSDVDQKLIFLNEIVKKYAINTPTPCISDITEADLCRSEVEWEDEVDSKLVEESNGMFNHMFDENYKKDTCDCYEF